MPAPATRGSPLEIGRAMAKRIGYSMPSPMGRSKVGERVPRGSSSAPKLPTPARAPGTSRF